jgi:pimeloyl-ACP methyl ester carboxylesterase
MIFYAGEDREIGFDDVGRDIPLLLFHAFPLDRRMWAPLAERIGHKARTLAIDFPGLGESSGIGSIEDAATDGARLLDHLGIERAAAMGMSMGGYVALAFARNHPQRLAGLVLANTRSGADSDEQRAARDRGITQLVEKGLPFYAAEMIPKLVPEHNPKGRDFALAMASLQTSDGVASALAALRDRPDATPGLASINVPTTIITGTRDTLIPPSESEAMAKRIKGSQLVVIENAGHLSVLDAPEKFAVAVEELLGKVKI